MPRSAHSVFSAPQIGLGVDRAGGIVGRDRHHRAGARGDGAGNSVEIELIGGVRGHDHRAAVGHRHRHLVVEVVGADQDYLVFGIGDGEQGVDERHVAAGAHHQLALVVEPDAVLGAQLGAQQLAQRRNAPHRAVEVVGRRLPEAAQRLLGLRRRSVVDHALAQGDGVGILPDQGVDDRDHRRLHLRQPRRLFEPAHRHTVGAAAGAARKRFMRQTAS